MAGASAGGRGGPPSSTAASRGPDGDGGGPPGAPGSQGAPGGPGASGGQGAPGGPHDIGRLVGSASNEEGLSAFKIPLYKDEFLDKGLWLVAGPLPETVALRGPLLKSIRKLVEGTRKPRGGPRGGPHALTAAKADALLRKLDALAAQEGYAYSGFRV